MLQADTQDAQRVPSMAAGRGALVPWDLPRRFINPAIGVQQDGFYVCSGATLVKSCSPPLGAHQQRPAYALHNLPWWPHGILAVPHAHGSWGCPGVGLVLLSAGSVGSSRRGSHSRDCARGACAGGPASAQGAGRGFALFACVCHFQFSLNLGGLSVLLQQRCGNILEFSAVVGWPINHGNFRNNYSDGSKQAPKRM